MNQINGYSVIAVSEDHTYGAPVMLGAAWNGRQFVYVTARVDDWESATEWHWGNYFTNLDAAVESYNNRRKN